MKAKDLIGELSKLNSDTDIFFYISSEKDIKFIGDRSSYGRYMTDISLVSKDEQGLITVDRNSKNQPDKRVFRIFRTEKKREPEFTRKVFQIRDITIHNIAFRWT